MKIVSRKVVASNKLPSRFQIGDRVVWNQQAGVIGGVLFEPCKVRYLIDCDEGTYVLANSMDVKPEICGASKAPAGWVCTRIKGHTGPCAAIPTGDEQ